MGFRGREFAFDSPAAAVAGMVSRMGGGWGVERVGLGEARGRVLAEDVCADRESPAFDHSAMDGYAVRVEGLVAGLEVVGESRIGEEPARHEGSGRAVRIATGAGMPAGADAVIRREDVVEIGEPVRRVEIAAGALARVRVGENVRRRGENAARGAVVLRRGRLISAATVGTLAAVGCARVAVCARVRVGIITTGDELVDAGCAALREYEVRNSNGPGLAGMLGGHAWVDVKRVVHVRDEGEALEREVRGALDDCDIVVMTGGVSMGHRDPVRGVVERVGAEVVFHGLPQRPGKPMLGAVVERGARGVVVFGLPGNPVSAMVTARRIVVPVMAARGGMMDVREPVVAEIANADGKSLELWWHRLARVGVDGRVELVDTRGSGDIVSCGRAEGFVEIAPGEAGSRARFYAWDGV